MFSAERDYEEQIKVQKEDICSLNKQLINILEENKSLLTKIYELEMKTKLLVDSENEFNALKKKHVN